jgi:type II secretion system protein G
MNLLLAVAILLQDKAAEEAFQKIADTFEKAKTVTLEFKAEVGQKRGNADAAFLLEGTLLLKEGRKVNLTARTRTQGMEDDFAAVCDGEQIFHRNGKRSPVTKDAPKEFAAHLAAMFSRGGMFMTFADNMRPVAKSGNQDPKTLYAPLNLKQGEDDKDAKTLVYGLKFPEGEMDCVLRYDPKTWIPSGRTMTVKQNGAEAGTIRETYKTFVLDAELPDEKFKLPAGPTEADLALGKKVNAARLQLAHFHTGLAAYEIDEGAYPTTEQGLRALVQKPATAKNWKGPYLPAGNEILNDPWGNPFVYRFPGVKNPNGFEVSSNGPDGKPGSADDIGP